MGIKFLPINLNPIFNPPSSQEFYTCEMTILSKMCYLWSDHHAKSTLF